MKLRASTLWRVPAFCLAASFLTSWLTILFGSRFFGVSTVGDDGITQISIDPVRSAVFGGALFVAVLLVGGLWAFRSMTKAEIAVSGGIMSAVYLFIVLAQIFVPDFPLSASLALAYVQDWTATLGSILMKLTGWSDFSAIAASFAPMLFVPFGRKGMEI